MSEKQFIDTRTGQIYESAEQAFEKQQEIQQQERKEEAEKKNPPFIQLTKGVSPDVLAKISRENSTAIEVLMFFFKNMDDYNVIMVSQQVIAETIGSSRRTVARALKVLEDNGAIGIAKVSNANVYIINPEVAWQKGFKQRGVVKMKAVVMLGKDENEKLFNRFKGVHQTSEENSLKIDHVATKIAMKQPKTQPTQTEKPSVSVEHLEETEYNDSVIPEDVPPWEE